MKLSETTPEVMHYTSAGGLRGIVESQSLWATNSGFLNDSTEIQWFFEKRLFDLIAPVMHDFFTSHSSLEPVKQAIKMANGLDHAVRNDAAAFVDAARTTTLNINTPFVASFSAPHNDWVAQHGLLSQWRGYGTDGGYVIVFDTAGLEGLLESEHARYEAFWGQFGDVYYLGGPAADDLSQRDRLPEISEAEKTIAAAVSEWLRTSNIRKLDDAYGPITSLSCACKHWGFHEERETRIVVNPMTSELLQKAPNQEQQVKPLKEIKHRDQSGSLVPYIELFKGSDNPLPIKRVIVGPHLNQDARQRGIESLLRSHGVKADVVKSDIPLVVG